MSEKIAERDSCGPRAVARRSSKLCLCHDRVHYFATFRGCPSLIGYLFTIWLLTAVMVKLKKNLVLTASCGVPFARDPAWLDWGLGLRGSGFRLIDRISIRSAMTVSN